MMDVEKTIISQYANSPTICQLIRNMNAHIDPQADIDNFFYWVWNVDTAQGFGLDDWGRIVNISRYLTLPTEPFYFGFSQQNEAQPFDQAPFYNGTGETQTYALADNEYRKLILAKALSNITATTVPAINQMLQNLFADSGRCYVNDTGGMQMRYTFEFIPTPFQFAVLTQSGALARPAGVDAILIAIAFPVFGFSEQLPGVVPFGEGTFFTGGVSAIV